MLDSSFGSSWASELHVIGYSSAHLGHIQSELQSYTSSGGSFGLNDAGVKPQK